MSKRLHELSPLTLNGWLISLILIPLSFVVYYIGLYEEISAMYQKDFWSSATYLSSEDNIHVRVHIPKYIADFVSREIRLEVWSEAEERQMLTIVVESSISDDNKECPSTSNLNPPFIYVTTLPINENNTTGSSAAEIEVPPFGTSVSTMWVGIKPMKGIQNGQCVTLQFYLLEKMELQPQPMAFEDRPDGKFTILFDRFQTLRHSLISHLLLPPWSNAVLPSVIFSLVWFVEKSIKPDDEREK